MGSKTIRDPNAGNRWRSQRMQMFLRLIDPLLDQGRPVRILDIGGTPEFWKTLSPLYRRDGVVITVLNLDGEEGQDENLLLRSGNGCATGLPSGSFDIVHSNSVIEHVGHWPEMQQLAAEVRRLAPAYFVQTPNLYFPIEPHFRLPIVHWLPKPLRALALRATGKAANAAEAKVHIERIDLLGPSHMRTLFPDAVIWKEKFGVLTKSIVAWRAPHQ